MRRLYLADSAPGDIVEDVYVLTNKQFSATSTGKHCIKAFVSDRSAQLTARMWNATREIFNAIPEAGFLKVRGRIENYQNNLQFIIEQLWPAKPGAFDVADLIPHTEKNIPQMRDRLVEALKSVRNRHLAALMGEYLADQPLMEAFCKAPAAMSFHHAYLGGLLEHTLGTIDLARAIAPLYPALNADILVAGLFLHDLAKTWELSYECAFGYTDGGQLVGHIVKSAVWLEEKARAAGVKLGEPIPQPLVDVLQHIIISHHGVPEFGAIKQPATPEAIAIHLLDNLDAKLMISLSAARGEPRPGCEGNWSEFLKALGGRIYRPDVAPEEAPEQPPAIRQSQPAGPPTLDMKITNPLFEQRAKK